MDSEKLRLKVLERDSYLCINCLCEGRLKRAEDVHHIVHRGKAPESLIWRLENMISLCRDCHNKANSKEAKRRHLHFMEERYGYRYEKQPWIGILGRASLRKDILP